MKKRRDCVHCLGGGLDSQRIAVVVSSRGPRGPEVDDCVVPPKLLLESGPHCVPEVLRAWPIGRSIYRAPVTEHDGGVAGLGRGFELTLRKKDGALRRSQLRRCAPAGKATAEQDAGSFGEDHDMLAERLSHEGEHGGLAGARPAGEHHAAESVRLSA